MSALTEVREAFRAFVAVTKEIPHFIDQSVTRWCRDQHRPIDLGEDMHPRAVCFAEHKPWPCDQWISLDEQLDAGADHTDYRAEWKP